MLAFGLLPVLALNDSGGRRLFEVARRMGSRFWSSLISSPLRLRERFHRAVLLSYQPDTVDKDLGAARDRLTGAFKDSYTQLIHDVVIPGAKKQRIAAVATVPAAASVSATPYGTQSFWCSSIRWLPLATTRPAKPHRLSG